MGDKRLMKIIESKIIPEVIPDIKVPLGVEETLVMKNAVITDMDWSIDNVATMSFSVSGKNVSSILQDMFTEFVKFDIVLVIK